MLSAAGVTSSAFPANSRMTIRLTASNTCPEEKSFAFSGGG